MTEKEKPILAQFFETPEGEALIRDIILKAIQPGELQQVQPA